MKRWDLQIGELPGALAGHTDWIARLAACDTEGLLFTGFDNNTANRWRLKSGELSGTSEGHTCRSP